MKTNEALRIIGESEFLDKIYNFAYRRCNTSHEAEDLCSDIILSVIKSVKKQQSIENFYAFVWTIAHRAYADHCQKQKFFNGSISLDDSELPITSAKNEIEEFIEEESGKEQLKKVFNEIAVLSKIYREVMVMFYIDEMKTKEIAERLSITETAVKQRLFTARNTVKKEVDKMDNRNLSLKPVSFSYVGTGSPMGNDPSIA